MMNYDKKEKRMLLLGLVVGLVVGAGLVVFFSKHNKNTIAAGSDALHKVVDPVAQKVEDKIR